MSKQVSLSTLLLPIHSLYFWQIQVVFFSHAVSYTNVLFWIAFSNLISFYALQCLNTLRRACCCNSSTCAPLSYFILEIMLCTCCIIKPFSRGISARFWRIGFSENWVLTKRANIFQVRYKFSCSSCSCLPTPYYIAWRRGETMKPKWSM